MVFAIASRTFALHGYQWAASSKSSIALHVFAVAQFSPLRALDLVITFVLWLMPLMSQTRAGKYGSVALNGWRLVFAFATAELGGRVALADVQKKVQDA